jgi:ProP effector
MVDMNRPGRGGNRDAGRGSLSLGSDDTPEKSTPQAGTQDESSSRHDAPATTIKWLAQSYPNCFMADELHRRPLKVRIDADIRHAVPGAITWRALKKTLRSYTSSPAYLRALRAGAERIDLAGNPAGVVTATQEEHAAERLALLANATEREPASEATTTQAQPVSARPAPRPTPPPPKSRDMKAASQAISTPPAPKQLGLRQLKAAWQERQRNRAAGDATDN